MGENSGIQWTHHTFNPWVGCQRVSPGCTNCYAEAYDKRVGGRPKSQRADPNVPELRWGPKAPRVRTSPANWRQPLKWNAAAKAAGARHRVFCSSLADVFEDRRDVDAARADLVDLISRTTSLDWLLLTKRPENVLPLLRAIDGVDGATVRAVNVAQRWVAGTPPPNVWLGTTVEDQQRANERIPALLEVPARVRFLSCEPLLEPVDLSKVQAVSETFDSPLLKPDWIIIGGESGPGARPFDLSWARSLVRQARSAGAAPFVKQLGAVPVVDESEWRAGNERGVHLLSGAPHARKSAPEGTVPLKFNDAHAGEPSEWPEDLRVREFPTLL